MSRDVTRLAVLLCMGLILLMLGPQASAAPSPAGLACAAGTGTDTTYAQIAAQPDQWDCNREDWSIRTPRTILRLYLDGMPSGVNDHFVTRLTRFESLQITVFFRDGGSATRTLKESDMVFAKHDWLMSAPLPPVGNSPAEVVVVQIDGARHPGMVTDAQIAPDPDTAPGALRFELLLAGLCGILLVPLVFNLAFFKVLRERFLLWHALAVLCMLLHTFTSSGLINRFLDLSMMQISVLSAISWGGGVVAAALFLVDLVEPGKLDPLHRRISYGFAAWTLAWTVFYLFADGPFRVLATPLYYASFAPILAFFVWVMAVAKHRGSRAINFQIVAWMPIMLTCTFRLVTTIGLVATPMEFMLAQHISMALEVIITSLGVADRFMFVKRQRDHAIAQTKVLEGLAERDPLTGMLNRHGIEQRFEEMRMIGFDTMALIDLDRFKLINDTYGHATGDEVLRAAADALLPDENTFAVRMGGEEFLLLLRGKDAAKRAERRRQAISSHIASRVVGLDRIVTASMGLVEQPRNSQMLSNFTTLYAHCDRLLYEAKSAGRNRTMSEKVKRFSGNCQSISVAA